MPSLSYRARRTWWNLCASEQSTSRRLCVAVNYGSSPSKSDWFERFNRNVTTVWDAFLGLISARHCCSLLKILWCRKTNRSYFLCCSLDLVFTGESFAQLLKNDIVVVLSFQIVQILKEKAAEVEAQGQNLCKWRNTFLTHSLRY